MKKNLFFIDDDDGFLYLLERICEEIDQVAKIHTATDGKNALDKIDIWLESGEQLPDIMFIDINMPIMDGFEFIEHFKQKRQMHNELNQIIPIFILTSSQQETDMQQADKTGIIDKYVIKPGDIQDIEKMLIDTINAN